MKQILILFLLISFSGVAQDDAKYLTGSVPEVDGKVVFEKVFSLPQQSKERVFDLAADWAGERFNNENSRVVFSDAEKGDLAAVGEDYLVFTSSALSLDRSLMSYRVLMHCEDGQLRIKVNGIRYEYNVSYQREPEKYVAEEWITDEAALSKGKLNRINGKFRKGTIDFINDLFDNVATSLAVAKPDVSTARVVTVVPVEPVASVPVIREKKETAPVVAAAGSQTVNAALEGYKQIRAENIPGNIIKMLSQDWMLITAGNNSEFNMMTASWGGLGYLFGKPAAFCFINPTRYTYPLMEKYETYTLSFYTEAYRDVLLYCGNNSGKDKDKIKETGLTPITTPSGSKAFNEAWMIIECRKLVSQPLSQESISNEEVRKEWIGKQVNKMFVGEIINVWIK
ncbi:DUF4468 domain-containing protein [Massilibacteroides sp.]|uniref:DUF4468 domain-containing protein n=1 Tax=Massilibacteroides sp. TaxID=2034766 RepID=UPI002601A75A|nr:DUF4468 domain-containing protein [Massilibacteroides sp.]MDD4515357.1 DUF4468 domain-containing protein [Massilibacteroides sp.]